MCPKNSRPSVKHVFGVLEWSYIVAKKSLFVGTGLSFWSFVLEICKGLLVKPIAFIQYSAVDFEICDPNNIINCSHLKTVFQECESLVSCFVSLLLQLGLDCGNCFYIKKHLKILWLFYFHKKLATKKPSSIISYHVLEVILGNPL